MFLSEEYARSVGWRTQLVPRLLSYSIAIGLLIQSGFIAGIVAYVGTDKLRFLAPVYPYDSIRVDTEALYKKETKKVNWVCSYKWVIRNQSDEAVAQRENT
jgi:acyl dehydratase